MIDVPDLSRSRAILIGTAIYQDPEFAALPAASNSIAGIWQVLSDPDLCNWPRERITVLESPTDVRRVVQTLRQLARNTSDVLLIYFVGHGVLMPRARLCLVLSDTVPEHPDVTGLEYDRVREALLDSPARLKIVILDCCYSGRAIEALSTAAGIADCTDTAGTYTLTASDLAAHVVSLDKQVNVPTSFTGELLDLLRTGIPGGPEQLTLALIYSHLRSRLRSRNLPTPNQRGTETASQFPFTLNRARKLPASPLQTTRARVPVGATNAKPTIGHREVTSAQSPAPVCDDPVVPQEDRSDRGRGSATLAALPLVVNAFQRLSAHQLHQVDPPKATDSPGSRLKPKPHGQDYASGARVRPRQLAERKSLRLPRLVMTLGTLASLATVAFVARILPINGPRPQPTTSPTAYSFAPRQYDDGLVVARRWKLTGHNGSLLTEKITATSATGRMLDVRFTEPIPASIAASLRTVQFYPHTSKIVDEGRAVVWQLRIPAHGVVVIGYQVRVYTIGTAAARLTLWAKDLNRLAATLKIDPASLQPRSLRIRPQIIRITTGDTVRLTLTGLMSDGQGASKAVLSRAVWVTGNTAVATVDNHGKVTAVASGETSATARLGSIYASVHVVVSNPRPGRSHAPTYTPPYTPRATPTLTPSPI